jgi:transcriptional regulator with XRE-family HTH domain
MHYREGKSQREIQKQTGVDRKTISKYINKYEDQRKELNEEGDPSIELIRGIVESPYQAGKGSLSSAYPENWMKIGEFNGTGDSIFIDTDKAKKEEAYMICSKINTHELQYNFEQWFKLLLENEGRRFWL